MNKNYLDTITIDDFKDYFKYDFKYLLLYSQEEEYFKNDIVYNLQDREFYLSLINNNRELLSNTDAWELTEDELINFIADWQIQKAMFQAKSIFNTNLFRETEKDLVKMLYIYLSAHYLVIDNNMINNKLSQGTIASKSVDGVSVSYSIPATFQNNPLYLGFSKTSYGEKYLMYIIPRLQGYTRIVKGTTTI